MTKLIHILSILFISVSSFAQPVKDLPKTLVGKWKIERTELTINNEKKTQAIEDTSFYQFQSDRTYTLTCADRWGKAKIVGKWRQEENKVKLYDMIHISDVNGILPKSGLEYYVELKKINDQFVLFISSFDKILGCLHELYYKKTG